MGVHIRARSLHVLNFLYGLAESLAYPSGEKGGNIRVQMISTCFPRVEEGGVGGRRRHPVVGTSVCTLSFNYGKGGIETTAHIHERYTTTPRPPRHLAQQERLLCFLFLSHFFLGNPCWPPERRETGNRREGDRKINIFTHFF